MKGHAHTHPNPHPHGVERMQAVEFEGKPFSVSIKTLPIPTVQQPTDAVIRCTSSGICGSDLHIFHGRLPVAPPLTLGHEIVGIVQSIGDKVHDLKVGDRVIVSGIVAEDTLDGATEEVGALGLGDLNGFPQFNGGQAGFVRVPFASDNCLLLPPGRGFELDYVLLADIFPTANWALDCAGFVFGDVVVVFGAGPVGLLCVYSAFLRGASKVYSVDRVPARLAKAKSIGAIPIDFTENDPVEQILKFEPNGVDRACDCVGYECVNAEGVNVGNLVITQAINVTRRDGGIGLIGVYSPEDPGAANAKEKKGIFQIPYGTSWFQRQSIRGGIVPLRQYQPALKRLIESGRAKPSFIFDKFLHIDEAAKAYTEFSNHDFIKSAILFDVGENRGTVEENIEEQAPKEKKRKRNMASV